ncbi:hypothetical protein L1049_012202 [Liquidambar formosana]|uniref:Zinc-ribbon domain-containing protein n=1 Tax=Liquidambar formosana TaxID=63359 RepID=A0AAP0X3W3_LIQFO
MTSLPKVRLVRCPKCRKVLTELADVPLYKCGGCGIVLQAKNRKNDVKNTTLGPEDTDLTRMNESQHVSEDKESSSSSQKAIPLPTEECSLDQNNSSSQNEQPGAIKFCNEISSSTELPLHENDESSPVAGANSQVDENNESGSNSEDCNREPGNFSNEISSSAELACHENDEYSSPVAGTNSEVDENNENGSNFEDCNREQPGNFSNEISSLTELACHENDEYTSPVAGTNSEVDENNKNGSNFEDCNREQPGAVNFSNEISSSTELARHENDEYSSPVAGTNSEVDENNESGSNSEEYNREQPGAVNFSNEISSSTELGRHENDEYSSPVAGTNSEVDENNESESNSEECNRVQPGALNFSNEISSSTELARHENDEYYSPVAGTNSEVDENNESGSNSGDCNREQPGGVDFSNEISSSAELAHHENDEFSQVARAYSEVDDNNECASNFKSSSTDNLAATRGKSPIFTAEWIVNENFTSDTPIPQSNEVDKSQKSVLYGFDHLRSTDTLETTEPINPSSELSGTLAARSSHAYDGSVSSYDGTDDQVPDRHHLYKRTYKAADFVDTEERHKREKFPVNGMRRNSEVQPQARNSKSVSFDRKRDSLWDSDEPLEPTRRGHPVRNRTRWERDEFPYRVPFCLRGPQAGYENGSPSSYGHDEFQRSSSFRSPDKTENREQEKIKLLRMVYELQDQLNRTRIANGRVSSGVAQKEKQIPVYYNHEAPEEEFCYDFNHPRHPGRCRQGTNWPQQCRFSRMPFSGEATNNRLQVGHLCLHCCPQDWQGSAQLPPPVHYCDKGPRRAHSGRSFYYPYSSSSSSPLRYTDSEFPLWNWDTKSDDQRHKEGYMDREIPTWGHDTKSEDQRHSDHAMKKYYLREKHHLVKRHYRPVAGGAPFITCYRCFKLLQLPADFLLFKRRCHRLRCSACSEVLKFSLQNSTRILPYTHAPSAIDPPPSEVGDTSDCINPRNLASASRASDCSHAGPVSCSDDYGLSFCKSCSTEGEPVSLTPPFHALQGDANNGMSSGSSCEPMIERNKKFISKQSLNKYKNPVETYESAGPSSNMSNMGKFSSEIEELPPTKGSPLHRLMGYSSPSEVIDGSNTATSAYYPHKNPRSRS